MYKLCAIRSDFSLRQWWIKVCKTSSLMPINRFWYWLNLVRKSYFMAFVITKFESVWCVWWWFRWPTFTIRESLIDISTKYNTWYQAQIQMHAHRHPIWFQFLCFIVPAFCGIIICYIVCCNFYLTIPDGAI